MIKIIYNPGQAFRELKEAEKFPLMSLLILLTIALINNILLIPVTTKIIELTFSSMPISETQMEFTMALMYKMRYLQVLGSIFSYMFMLVAYTLLIWVLTKITKIKLSFGKAFELMINCCFVLAVGGLINTIILYARGLENITNMYEISLTGLNLFTSTESVGVVFYTFLSLINPFYIWFLALLTIGLMKIAETKLNKAFITGIIFWIIIIAFPVVMIFFSQVVMKSRGLM